MEMPSEISDCEALGKLRHDGETNIKCHPDAIRKRYINSSPIFFTICPEILNVLGERGDCLMCLVCVSLLVFLTCAWLYFL